MQPRGDYSTLAVGFTSQQRQAFVTQTSVENLSQNFSAEEHEIHAKNLLATGRQYWKTRGNNGEAIWPPQVERVLLEGLKRYQKYAWKPVADHRCPMRNKFIAEHIKKKTGAIRTPRQVSSRLQHLRDTCQKKSILELIVPLERDSPPTTSSRSPTPPSRPTNPYPSFSPPSPLPTPQGIGDPAKDTPEENLRVNIVQPVPIRPSAPLRINLDTARPRPTSARWTPQPPDATTPQSPTHIYDTAPFHDSINLYGSGTPKRTPSPRDDHPLHLDIDVLLDKSRHILSVPLISLIASPNPKPLQISLGSFDSSLNTGSDSHIDLSTVVQLVSPYPLFAQSSLSVFVSGQRTSIYTEAATLSCNSFPTRRTYQWFYTVSLVPRFWNNVTDAAGQSAAILEKKLLTNRNFKDPGEYTIEQKILPLRFVDSDSSSTYLTPMQAGTEITLHYRFHVKSAAKPPLTLLHYNDQGYPLLHNEFVWQNRSTPDDLPLFEPSGKAPEVLDEIPFLPQVSHSLY
ncbi:hypothetical protein DXG01_008479 [Tephrocybe rancida]|nr:hypothetical protein DXG01_008479 [Tephrocybe rancida]